LYQLYQKNDMNSQREFFQLNSHVPNHTKESNVDYILINGNCVNGFIARDGGLLLNERLKFICWFLSLYESI